MTDKKPMSKMMETMLAQTARISQSHPDAKTRKAAEKRMLEMAASWERAGYAVYL